MILPRCPMCDEPIQPVTTDWADLMHRAHALLHAPPPRNDDEVLLVDIAAIVVAIDARLRNR